MTLILNENELKVIGVIGFVQMNIFESIGGIPETMLQFKFQGNPIIDPTVTSNGYFRRDPVLDYGEVFLKSDFVTFIKKYEITDELTFEELSLIAARVIGDLQERIYLKTKEIDGMLTINHIGKKIINPFSMYLAIGKSADIDPVEHFGRAFTNSDFLKVINKALVTKNEYL
ncbi:TPA: hypothetical protein QC175_005240 [Bacillus cereus]|nr:hypothetical protein [Bacillus cereus]HDR8329470.1 hypothetical protein [Bacillus cereus]HDR8337556.1 hypothetical protein [Bacillus cereus]